MLRLHLGRIVEDTLGYKGPHPISNDPKFNPAGLKDVERDILKTGFVVYLKPSEFASLNPPRTRTRNLKSLTRHVEDGGKIGPARLSVKWDEDRRGWSVINHEGRGRMLVLAKMYQDAPVPVCVIPRDGTHVESLDERHLFAPIYSDDRVRLPTSIKPSKVYHMDRLKYAAT
jgi:hypothetical protein